MLWLLKNHPLSSTIYIYYTRYTLYIELRAIPSFPHGVPHENRQANSFSSSAQTLSTVAKGLAKEADKATLTAAEKRTAGQGRCVWGWMGFFEISSWIFNDFIGFFFGISMVDFVGGWFKWFVWRLYGDGDAKLSFWMGFFVFGVLRNCLHVFEDYSRALLNMRFSFSGFCFVMRCEKSYGVSGLGDGCGRRALQFIVLMKKMRIHSLRMCLKLVSDIKWISINTSFKTFKF